MSSSTAYRRPSMITLYEKLRAQDDDDDDSWLAEAAAPFDTDDKSSTLFLTSIPSPPSVISSGSSSSSPSSLSSPVYSYESEPDSDGDSGSDSDSDVEFLELSPEPHYIAYEDIEYHEPTLKTGVERTPDLPYVPPFDHPSPRQPSPVLDGRVEYDVEPEAHVARLFAFAEESFASQPPAITQSSTRSTRASATQSFFAGADSDEDAEGESVGNVTDDEYMPSPSIQPRKRRRNRSDTPSTSFSDNHDIATSSARRSKRPRQSPQPRNIQLPADADLSATSARSRKSNPWACPHCSWVQRNHRTPDLKRHIRTHTRFQRPAQWVCCGVAMEMSGAYKVPADAQPYTFQGQPMIGGCGKEFSRRDALKRHLDNKHITCVGDLSLFAQVESDD
ncbi:hypothetical protein BV22DRAFT_208149 [Leucogyrophana mollusca]|uniref:Uncharacterized protein n=1 Tax=Leucogyrophana mollusca TaxID=85980 RepID=A0ACB8BS06_9AGAM|nr:hypothetical protein BV22DRAFT_208149 [Leucogyrophana mollusca]